MMKVVFARQKIEKSIFLAGPTPRSLDVPSWRPEALAILDGLDFEGVIYIPESEDWRPHSDYDGQLKWEWEAMNQATVIAFWVPREMGKMPALTTNVEFGLSVASSKALLGYPAGAEEMRYLDALARRYHVPVFDSLKGLMEAAVETAMTPYGAA